MTSKRLVYALIALGVLFAGFCWWVYFSSAGTLSIWVPVLGTLLPLLIAGAWWAHYLWAGKSGAAELESAIVEDSDRERNAASGAQRAELEGLRSEFERAVKALKNSKLGQGSGRASSALYRLPWYAIIGPPASGKTTVLRNSGLKFPYLPGTGDRLKGVGGTRNCDWWLTNQAILLDTAGRWSIEENERDEWLAFLDLLKKHRGERPLNGIIAAISISGDPATSISTAAEDELREIALRMRERLDEITGRLGVALPVYLLFTKCDLLTGFVETFGSMSHERRKQIWGFTAPVLQGVRRDPGSYFAQQFELLRDELERRALVRMGEEVDPRVMPLIYEFPAQFGALKDKLTFFVDELFDASAYRETPLLRGAYFTSGTQEGAPADLLFEDIAGELRLRPRQYESRDEKKSYFLHDMLLRVVFEDRELATTSDKELVRRHWQRRAITSALFAGSTLLTVLATDSCQHNLRALAHTESSLAGQETARKTQASARPDLPVPQLSELVALDSDVGRYQQGGRGITDLGLYQGERISPVLERYDQNALAEAVIRPLLERNQARLLTRTQQLQASAVAGEASALEDSARDELRDALALQLLLTTPRESCTPKLLARQPFIAQQLLGLWQVAVPARDEDQESRKKLLTRYIELASQDASSLTLANDPRAIERARRALGDDDQIARVLQRELASYPVGPRTLVQIAGPSLSIESRTTVAGSFSREAWAKLTAHVDARSFLESDGDWVFGCSSGRHDEARAELDVESFRERYLKRYEQGWRDFLGGLSGRSPGNIADAENMLGELASRPGVLGALFQSVRENTTLTPVAASAGVVNEATSRLSAAVDALPGTDRLASGAKQLAKLGEAANRAGLTGPTAPQGEQFAEPLHQAFADFASFDQPAQAGGATGLDQYRRLLEPVLAAIKAYRQDESKVEALASATQSALDNTELLLRGQSTVWGSQLQRLLEPVLSGTLALVQRGRATQNGRDYCDAVYAPFQRELAGRFPLKPDSSEPANMSAFARFFQPGSGSVWAYQASHLGGYVTSEGGRFRFTGTKSKELFRDELLEFLQRAAAISQAFFPEGASGSTGASGPRMPFKIRVRGAPGYSSTTFRVGKRAVTYDSGVESWVPVEWPGGAPESGGVSLSVTPYQGQGPRPLAIDNPWGFFMILQKAQIFEQSGRILSVGWRPLTGQNYVKVDFASDDTHSPLSAVPFGVARNRLFPLYVPARISQLGSVCGAVRK